MSHFRTVLLVCLGNGWRTSCLWAKCSWAWDPYRPMRSFSQSHFHLHPKDDDGAASAWTKMIFNLVSSLVWGTQTAWWPVLGEEQAIKMLILFDILVTFDTIYRTGATAKGWYTKLLNKLLNLFDKSFFHFLLSWWHILTSVKMVHILSCIYSQVTQRSPIPRHFTTYCQELHWLN